MSNKPIHKISASDVPANIRRGGVLRTLLGPATVGATCGFMGLATLETGEYISEHYHPYSEEFLYLVSGEIVVRLDGDELNLVAGDGVLIPKDVRHRLENRGVGQASMVFQLCPLAPRPELGHVDTEPLPAANEEQLIVGAGA